MEERMIQRIKGGALVAATLLAAACSSPSEKAEAPVANAQDGALPLPLPAPAMASTVSIARANERLDFTYSFPGEAASIPALDAWLREDAASGEREAAAAAEKQAGTARHIYAKRWTVQANAPGILSLAAQYVRTSGGENPMAVWRTLLWDRQAGQPVDFAALFTDYAAIMPSLQQRVCTALAAERQRRQSAATGPCPPLDRLHVAPASGAVAGPIRMLRLFADPGVAAPTNEGNYEARLPVDGALVRAVRPEYRGAFAVAL
jgi:hypothetical protein